MTTDQSDAITIILTALPILFLLISTLIENCRTGNAVDY